MGALDPFYASLGRLIRDLRHRRGLTQAQLGSRISPCVTRASIANIEAGKQGILTHTLVQLAEVLRVAPGALLKPERSRDTGKRLRDKVEKQLVAKLPVTPEASRKLMERLLAETDTAGRDHERPARAKRG